MLPVLRKTISPLLSLILLIFGNGYFLTYVTVRLHLAQVSTAMIGAVSAAFYVGLVIGSFNMEPFIRRIGHIRAYATFAALLTVFTLIQSIYINPWLWLLLRLMSGYCMAALFITIESWLLEKSTPKTRGQILSLYMLAFYGAQAFGQFLLKIGHLENTFPFIIAATLSCLSIIPLTMTYATTPHFEESSALSFKKLYQLSPIGVFGALCSGLIIGATYGLLPLYVSQTQNIVYVADLMGITILGGMALQYPVGKLSDIFDRRKIILLIMVGTLIVNLLILTPFAQQYNLLFILLFLFGGFTFTIYPLSISYACDHLESKNIVRATQGLLLAYSIGAAAGPLIAPSLINLTHNYGLFIYFLIVECLLVLLIIWRSLTSPGVPPEKQQAFIAIPRTTPVGAELNPRQNKRKKH